MTTPPAPSRLSLSFRAALLAFVAATLLATIVPAAVLLDRWLARELELRAWRDVTLAPAILEDRNRAINDALMMHAKDVAHTPELGAALSAAAHGRAMALAETAARSLGHAPILVTAGGVVLSGPRPPADMLSATRRGEMPVKIISSDAGLWLISVAPVEVSSGWTGVAGVANPLDSAAAAVLATITSSDLVVITTTDARQVLSRSGDIGNDIAALVRTNVIPQTRELDAGGARFLVSTGEYAGATVSFVRDMRPVLAILPQLRLAILAGSVAALALALILASGLARRIVRPVRGVAEAADRLARGEFGAPLPTTEIRELQRVSEAFHTMRSSLATRIDELRTANRMLEERQARLSALQAELIRRERVAASSRVVAELAHEIRNPVASLRNCLELLHRRLAHDPQGQEYAALAIDELLRMHELAERMLHLNRPNHSGDANSAVDSVVNEVVGLLRLAKSNSSFTVVNTAPDELRAAIPPDALKQVLLNLAQNAREAVQGELKLVISTSAEDGRVVIVVSDNGPGVPDELRSRIFDPFFTTREAAGGVGLGLFVVEGVVRGFGGRVALVEPAGARTGSGAAFRIELPRATAVVST